MSTSKGTDRSDEIKPQVPKAEELSVKQDTEATTEMGNKSGKETKDDRSSNDCMTLCCIPCSKCAKETHRACSETTERCVTLPGAILLDMIAKLCCCKRSP